MSNFEIEKGIPYKRSTRKRGAGRKRMYPFDQMEVGDSFFVPLAENKNIRNLQACLCVCSKKEQSRSGKDFKVSIYEDETKGLGVRVWRIK